MKVVALVSGGKDSCYAMMKCIHYGHEIVALANLLPIDDSVDELDSYMYQTVGHQIIVNYSECMGVPLFRRRIQGSTRVRMLKEAQVLHVVYPGMFTRLTRTNTGRKLLSKKNIYPGDEVEDMFLLLHEVKRQIPSITAVSSGAIGSDYQRLRVESVCSRLGLVSLAYLWKQDQLLLLREMVNNGILAITVKVAAMGLDPAKHLGKEISALESYLHKLNKLYGINVCGEGGEYETLTLDCPLFVNARIVLEEYKVVLHSSDSIAPVGVLHPVAFHLENKAGSSFAGGGDSNHAINDKKVNYLFEVNGDCQLGCEATSSSIAEEADTFELLNVAKQRCKISKTKKGDTFSIGCWLIDSCNTSPDLRGDLGALLRNIESELLGHGFGWENVLYVHLYISDMTEFAAANELYVRFIKQERCPYGVPSRSTIELPLLEVGLGSAYIEILVAGDHTKRVLHVQSISSWAPSCIGPYSQATLHKEILHMAGQLGLDPPTMTLCNGGPTAELEQALENSEAVAKCFNCSIYTSAILFSLYCSTDIPLSERCKVEDKLQATLEQMRNSHSEKASKSKVIDPVVLYILAPCLPKRALVEVKPILFVSENIEEVIETEQYLACNSTPTCWGFEEAPWHKSCLQKCVIRGKICALVLCITSNIAQKICSRSVNADEIAEEHLGMVSKFCIYLIDKTILENGFSWEDIMNLRIYFPTRLNVSLEALSLIFSRTFGELAEISQTFKVGKNPIFNLVPVLGSGKVAECMDDVVSCELFARKS